MHRKTVRKKRKERKREGKGKGGEKEGREEMYSNLWSIGIYLLLLDRSWEDTYSERSVVPDLGKPIWQPLIPAPLILLPGLFCSYSLWSHQ